MLVDDKSAVMTFREFMELLNYSASFPTGTKPGKRWRAKYRGFGNWWMGEYTDVETDPRGERFGKVIGIKWRRILIVGSLVEEVRPRFTGSNL